MIDQDEFIRELAYAIKEFAELQVRVSKWSVKTPGDFNALLADLEKARGAVDRLIAEVRRELKQYI